MSGHIIVCGMGQAGYRVVDLLLSLGEAVTVVTESACDEWRQSAQRRGACFFQGDARNEELLLAAGIAEARALIAATDQDMVNVEIAMDAGRVRPDQPVVVRLCDQKLARQLEAAAGIRRALAMSALAAPRFATAAIGEEVLGCFLLEGASCLVSRLTIPCGSPLCGLKVREAARRHHVALLTHERSGANRALSPHLSTELCAGHTVTLLGTQDHWRALTAPPDPARKRLPLRLRAAAALGRVRRRAGLAQVCQMWRSAPPALRAVFVTLNGLLLLSV